LWGPVRTASVIGSTAASSAISLSRSVQCVVGDYICGMREGDEVPDFELMDQDNQPSRLSTLLEDGPVVLFFYPAAMTTGCTKEACHFRDLGAEFAAAGVQRVGIS